MSDLFEINRSNLKKIFETHQIRGCILFTDILKISTATRIFPNLLTSKDLRKLIIQVTNVVSGDELSAKLSFEEMEEFLKGVAAHSYPSRRGVFEQNRMLFLHMRNPCYLRYNIILETEERPRQETSKVAVKTTHGVFFRPSSDKSLLSASPYRSRFTQKNLNNLNALISPKVNNNFGFSLRLQEESSRDSSAQPSPKVIHTERTHENKVGKSYGNNEKNEIEKITEAFLHFKARTSDLLKVEGGIREYELQKLMEVRKIQVEKQAKRRYAFQLWKAISRLG